MSLFSARLSRSPTQFLKLSILMQKHKYCCTGSRLHILYEKCSAIPSSSVWVLSMHVFLCNRSNILNCVIFDWGKPSSTLYLRNVTQLCVIYFRHEKPGSPTTEIKSISSVYVLFNPLCPWFLMNPSSYSFHLPSQTLILFTSFSPAD